MIEHWLCVSLFVCPNSYSLILHLRALVVSTLQSPRVIACFAMVLHNIVGFIQQSARRSFLTQPSSQLN